MVRRHVREHTSFVGYAVALLIPAAVSALHVVLPVQRELAEVILVYLLGVVVVATRYGFGPSLFSAALSVLAFDYFFIPPLFAFPVHEYRDAVTLGVMSVVAFIVSGLTERLRGERGRAQQSERRANALYALEQELSAARQLEQLASVAAFHLASVVAADVTLLRSAEGVFVPLGSSAAPRLSSRQVALAERALSSRRAIWPEQAEPGFAFVPIIASHETIGVALLQAENDARFSAFERDLIAASCRQIGSAWERLLLAADAAAARLQVETEKVRNALLSSVSHDLKTPLALISASAEMLVQNHAGMSDGVRGELLSGIATQADRLDALVRNLLAMTRVESGGIDLRLVPGEVEEVVAAAIRRAAHALGERKVVIHQPRHLPLVAMDALLLEQVFVNLLDNAAKYSPERAPIHLSFAAAERELCVEIEDEGPGVPDDELEKVFEKFYRGRNASRSDGGAGLGLAICRAIVTAHGGSIGLARAARGGARVSIRLPATFAPFDEASERLPELA